MLGEDIMEYFELTFFCPKNVYNKESIGFIADNFNFYDNFEKNIHVEFFSEEEKDFDEFCVNLSDFKGLQVQLNKNSNSLIMEFY